MSRGGVDNNKQEDGALTRPLFCFYFVHFLFGYLDLDLPFSSWHQA